MQQESENQCCLEGVVPTPPAPIDYEFLRVRVHEEDVSIEMCPRSQLVEVKCSCEEAARHLSYVLMVAGSSFSELRFETTTDTDVVLEQLLKSIFDKVLHLIRVRHLIVIWNGSRSTLALIVAKMEPGTLGKVSLRDVQRDGELDDVTELDLDEVALMESWKRATQLHVGAFQVRWRFEHFSHFNALRLFRVSDLTRESIRLLSEHYTSHQPVHFVYIGSNRDDCVAGDVTPTFGVTEDEEKRLGDNLFFKFRGNVVEFYNGQEKYRRDRFRLESQHLRESRQEVAQ